MAANITKRKHTVSQNFKEPNAKINGKGHRKDTTSKDFHHISKGFDLQNKNTKEQEIHEDPALVALKENDEKWLTHFLMTELDDLFISSQKEMEEKHAEKLRKLVEKEQLEKKKVEKKRVEKKRVEKNQMAKKKLERKRVENKKVLKKHVENKKVERKQAERIKIEKKQVERYSIVRRRDLYWFPLPAAVGSPEYNIRIEEVLDSIKKHVKIDDIVELPEDKEGELPVIRFNIFEYFWSIGQDNKIVDTENIPIL